MASNTTICAKTINCETINFKDSTDITLVKGAKFTFDDNNRAYFKIMWPANYYLSYITLIFNENLIGGTSTDDTIIHVADGTTKITENGATSIVEGVAPGINGEVYADDDSDRTIGTTLSSNVGLNRVFSALFSTEDRTFSGLIYNSGHGTQNFASPASITNKSTFIGNIVFHGTKFII